jgi:hypothetical protein
MLLIESDDIPVMDSGGSGFLLVSGKRASRRSPRHSHYNAGSL